MFFCYFKGGQFICNDSRIKYFYYYIQFERLGTNLFYTCSVNISELSMLDLVCKIKPRCVCFFGITRQMIVRCYGKVSHYYFRLCSQIKSMKILYKILTYQQLTTSACQGLHHNVVPNIASDFYQQFYFYFQLI